MKKQFIILWTFLLSSIFATIQGQTLDVDVVLEYISDNSFKLSFNKDVNIVEASKTANYTLSGTGGITGNPLSAIVVGNKVTLQIPSDIRTMSANESLIVKLRNITSTTGDELSANKSVAKYFLWHFFEGLDDANLDNTYTNKSYIGGNNVPWFFEQGRDGVVYDKGIMLRLNNERSFLASNNMSDGIGDISFDYYKVYSNNDNRSFKVTYNGTQEDIVDEIVVPQGTTPIYKYTSNLNLLGENGVSTMRISNISPTNQNIVLDNIRWTSYTAPKPLSIHLLSNNKIEVVFNQIIDESSLSTNNFSITKANETATVTSVELSQGNLVHINLSDDLSQLNNGDLINITSSGIKNFFNGVALTSTDLSVVFEKPEVIPKLEYVDFTTVKLLFTSEVLEADAKKITNYILGGTGGASGNPSAVTIQDNKTVLLTVPSTENYQSGETLSITVNNIRSSNGISTIKAPNNVAEVIIDRINPSVLSLEFFDMETLIVNFSETVVPSLDVTDYVFSGTAGIPPTPLSVNILNETSIELKVADMTSNFLQNSTITITVSNVLDLAENNIDPNSNTATYIVNLEKPVINIIKIDSILHRSTILSLEIDKRSTLFWSVFEEGNSTPTVSAITNETGYSNGSKIINSEDAKIDILIDELKWKTTYDLFIVAQSREGVYSDIESYLGFTTKGDGSFTESELSNYNGCVITTQNGKIIISRKETKEDTSKLDIKVYSINGSLLFSSKLNSNEMTLPYNFSNGIYIVVTTNKDGRTQVNKILVTN